MNKSTFFGQSFTSIDQITSVAQIDELFLVADYMKQKIEHHEVYEPLKGKSVAVLFYQPSTRTFSSFVSAANHLGAYVTAIHGMEEFSSVAKGETLEDTIQSIYQTTAADAIVLRHPQDTSSQIAASVSSVPVINAGSGTLEHPTQALLDLYTIQQHFLKINQLHIVMVGDMLYGRTIKSLAKILTLYKDVKITFVSPDELKAPNALVKLLQTKINLTETDNLESVLQKADVVYMTRVQKEWFEAEGKIETYERLKQKYILSETMVQKMKPGSIVMHPLPRVGEILREVDEDPRAYYFTQMRSGLYVRMALLQSILV
jgi:aspartate carbamoyltransferase